MHPFYEKVTDRGRKALKLANSLAAKKRHPLVTPLHILWGILEENSNVAVAVLKNMKVDIGRLKSRIEDQLGTGAYSTYDSAVCYDAASCQTICSAIDIGCRVRHIGCQHLLLAMIDRPPVDKLLNDIGLTSELVWAEINVLVKPVYTS